MKHCPTCGGSYSDRDTFCESDGTTLAVISSNNANANQLAPAESPCEACGALGGESTDGTCASCGHRVANTSPWIPANTPASTFEIVHAIAPDQFVARKADGAEVVVVTGDASVLSGEANVLKSLGGQGPFPKLEEFASDSPRGAYLVVSPVPKGAWALVDVAATISLSEVVRIIGEVISTVEKVEATGFQWNPKADDVFLRADKSLIVSRLRVRELPADGKADARAAVEVIGALFLPEPGVRGPLHLVRILLCRMDGWAKRPQTWQTIRAELDVARAQVEQLKDSDESSAIKGSTTAAPREPVFAICDPGIRRNYNEDAVGIAHGEIKGEPWIVMVVCDGVSSSSHAELASDVGAKTACASLVHFAKTGDILFEGLPSAMASAIRAAHVAVCTQAGETTDEEPPGTTLVAAVVFRNRVTIGWVGDSRAYWIAPNGVELLTRDHSWVNEVIDRGEMTEAEAMRQPLAHALTRCLGPLEVADGLGMVEPDVRTRDLPGPGYLLLCSDGLWNYFPKAVELTERIKALGPEPSLSVISRALVNFALVRGGHDNVTVALCGHGLDTK